MKNDFKVGDIVRILPDLTSYASEWDRKVIQDSILVIIEIADPGIVNTSKPEFYVKSTTDPDAHISKSGNWFFWRNEIVKDEFLSAIHHRRSHGA